MANLSLPTTERFTDGSGTRQARTEWHRVVAFGRLADTCDRFLSKGRREAREPGAETPHPLPPERDADEDRGEAEGHKADKGRAENHGRVGEDGPFADFFGLAL